MSVVSQTATATVPIGSFHKTSVKFKLKNYWSSWDIQIAIGFVINCAWISKLLRDALFKWRPRAVMLVEKVTYFWEFGYLNSSCVRKSIMFLSSLKSRFCSKTKWLIFLLVSGRHVVAHPDGHQHGVTIQISIKLGKKFLRISKIAWPDSWRESLHIYLLSFPRFWT